VFGSDPGDSLENPKHFYHPNGALRKEYHRTIFLGNGQSTKQISTPTIDTTSKINLIIRVSLVSHFSQKILGFGPLFCKMELNTMLNF
jgi:hypothetical protein